MKNPLILFPEERRLEILKRINLDRRVSVVDLSQVFGVSQVTIRADLEALSQESRILRTHGGAVLVEGTPELSLSLRKKQNIEMKDRIGEKAASMIADGEAIFLDTSSTALALTRYLKRHHELTVVTNSLAVAQSLLDAPGVSVVMPGGMLQKDTFSLIGIEGINQLNRYNLQKGFFGANGIALREGLTDVDAAVAEVKKAMIRLCRERYAIIDSSKWGRVGLASFAAIVDLDGIITDNHAPADQIQEVQSLGIQVITV